MEQSLSYFEILTDRQRSTPTMACLQLAVYLLLASMIAFARIDDDWCDDRANGSDESLSSACSGFTEKSVGTCLDRKWVTQQVFSSRVRDGICDCCDGSDEENGVCGENSCESLGTALKESKRSYAEARVKGLVAKQAIVEKTRERFLEMENAMTRESKEGPILDQSIRVLEEKVVAEEKVEAEEVVRQAAIAMSVFKEAVQILAQGIGKEPMIDWIAALAIRCKEDATDVIAASLPAGGKLGDMSEAMIIALEAPSAKDGDLKQKEGNAGELVMNIDGVPVVGPLSYVLSKAKLSGSLLKDMKEALALSPIFEQSVLVNVLATCIQEAQDMEVLMLSALDATVFPELSFSEIKTTLANIPASAQAVRKRGHHSAQGDALREELKAARKKREDLKALASSATTLRTLGGGADGKTDLGPDNIYLHLVDKCFRKRHGSYSYSACPFKEAHQSNVQLGRFQGFTLKPKRGGGSSSAGGGDDAMLELSDTLKAELGLPITSAAAGTTTAGGQHDLWMVFSGGSFCHAAGRGREMHVKMECASEEAEELSDILEPETCFYMATLQTPIAC